MDDITYLGLVTSGITLLDAFDLNPLKLFGQQLAPKITDYVKRELFGEPTYRNRLAKVIDQLLDQYRQEYRVDPTSNTIFFFQTRWLWERVLTYQLFKATPPLSADDFPALPRLLPPTKAELELFDQRIAQAMASDPELYRRFYDERHKEISVQFALAATAQLNRIEAHLTQQASTIHPVLDVLEKNALEQYKPFTMLQLLRELAPQVQRQAADTGLQARFHYLLGLAHRETGAADQGQECFLQAYSLDKHHVDYAEQAALAYVRLALPDEARQVSTAIKALNPLNGVAHAVDAFLGRADFAGHLATIPAVVRRHEKFKLALVELLLQAKPLDFAQVETVLEQDLAAYAPAPALTFENRRFQVTLAMMVIQVEFDALPELTKLDQPTPIADPARLTAAYDLLRRYTTLLLPTEKAPLLTHHFYVQGLAGFKLHHDIREFAEFGRRYPALSPTEKPDYAWHWMCALFQSGDYRQALGVAEELGADAPAEFDYVRYHILLQLEEPVPAKAALALYLRRVEQLEAGTFDRMLRYLMGHCADAPERLAFVEEYLARRPTGLGLPELLLRAVAVAEEPSYRAQVLDWLQQAADLVEDATPSIMRQELARLYQVVEDYAQSAQWLADCAVAPGVQHPGIEVIRLRNLYHLYQHSGELRAGLRDWRLRHGILPEFCNWEVELAFLLPDWERILEVTEAVKDQFSPKTGARWAYLTALHRLQRRPELVAALEAVAGQPDLLTREQQMGAAGMAMAEGQPQLALRLAYPLACSKDDLVARSRYLALVLHGNPDLPQPTVVGPGTSVLYTVNGKSQARITVTSELLESGSNGLVDGLLGKTVGDSFELEHSLRRQPQRIEIVQITDCYRGLLREIMDELGQHEAAMPMQSFHFGSDTPTLAEINQTFLELFGEQDQEDKKQAARIRLAYRQREATFTQLAAKLHRGSGLEAYHWLTSGRPDSPGLQVVPGWLFTPIPDLAQQQLVLDWTSLPVLFALVQQHQLPVPSALWVSHQLREELREQVREKQQSRPVEMSLDFVDGEVQPHSYPPEMHARQLAYLSSLLAWVETNCQTRFVEEKLDILRQVNVETARLREQPLATVIDTAFLASGATMVAISDDETLVLLTLQNGGRVLSVEAFLRAYYPGQYTATLLPELLDRGYWGLQVEAPTLLREFVQAGHQFSARAQQALRNAALQAEFRPEGLQSLAHFVREVYLLPTLSDEQKRNSSSYALSLGLCYLDLTEATRTLVMEQLYQAFLLLPAYWSEVDQVLERAWQEARIIQRSNGR